MSEFLFVIPAGWTQISSIAVSEVGSVIGDWLAVNDLNALTEALRVRGDIPSDAIIVEARFFNGEVLAVRLES